jgi:hypothetical protein
VLTVDATGNIFALTGEALVKITPAGVTTKLLDTGRSVLPRPSLESPSALAVDRNDNVFVADFGDATIKRVSPALNVTVWAGASRQFGRADGVGTGARFLSFDLDLAIDAEDNVLVADAYGVRKITPAGVVSTIAGDSGVSNSFGTSADGNGTNARFGGELSIALNAAGEIYVADRHNNTIRKGTPLAHPARIANLSVLTRIEGPDDTVVMGTIVKGGTAVASLPVLARAAGPELATFGVAGFLDDPKLEVANSSGVMASNDNWAGGIDSLAAFARVGAFPFADRQSRDAALVLPVLPLGNYTMRVASASGAVGLVLAELYDTVPEAEYAAERPKLTNVSLLRNIGAGLTTGFIVKGEGTKMVLIRAAGPSLASFGVGGVFADPKIELIDSQGRAIAANDNWGGDPALVTAFARVGAFSFAAGSSGDSALITTLQPGSYTLRISSRDQQTGVVLLEIFDVP